MITHIRKIRLSVIVCLLILLSLGFFRPTVAQESTWVGPIPFGRGALSDFVWNHEGTHLAVLSPGRVWLYDSQFQTTHVLDLLSTNNDAIAWHPFQNHIAVTDGHLIRIYDIDHDLLVQNIPVPFQVYELAWNSAGDKLLTRGEHTYTESPQAWLQVWDVSQGKRLWDWELDSSIRDVLWQPETDRLVVIDDDLHLYVWNVVEENLDFDMELPIRGINDLDWRGQTSMLSIATIDGDVQLWELSEQSITQVDTISPPDNVNSNTIIQAKWDQDGTKLLGASFIERRRGLNATNIFLIWVWESDSFIFQETYEGIPEIAWQLPAQAITITSQNTQTIDLFTFNGEVAQSIGWHARQIESIAWQPDGLQIAYAMSSGGVYLESVTAEPRTFAPIHELIAPNTEQRIVSITWSADNQYFATSIGDIYRADTWEIVHRINNQFEFVVFSPNSQYLLVANPVEIYDVSTWERIWSAQNIAELQNDFQRAQPVWAPESDRISYEGQIVNFQTGSVRILSLEDNNRGLLLGNTWGQDAYLLTGHALMSEPQVNRFGLIWDTTTGQQLHQLEGAATFAWQQQNNIIVGSNGQVWSADMFEPIDRLRFSVSPENIEGLLWSSNGDTLATYFRDAYGALWFRSFSVGP